MKIALTILLFFVLVTLFVYAQPHNISKSIRLTITVLPKTELEVDDTKTETIDKDEEDTYIYKDIIYKKGKKIIRITKIDERNLF